MCVDSLQKHVAGLKSELESVRKREALKTRQPTNVPPASQVIARPAG